MARNDRLFDLIQILRDGQLHRAQDLGARLGVSTRTIWRDMATLIDSGLPIEGERGVGYVMKSPVSLPPLALNRDEFEALRLGLALASSLSDRDAARGAASLRAKINAVSPAGLQDPGVESLVFASPEAERAARHLAPIRRALRDHLVIEIDYTSIWGDPRSHILRPLHLSYWGRVWTLLGWCEKDGNFRLLRVDLIRSAEVTQRGFLPEAGKTAEDYLARLDGP
ncbi:YafY family transcriptional regulator [Loktanella sp. IMCC34160]|uniref:helix-turn-helix transcriptional regulator n=1 Tax=Loktanella sp. IMCC34160 TaxID=2510646 RepID=UPI00101E0A76|nr:YafY family protein [Loktanella sp. IMCC34160]RYG92859.1 YafY family transcriptional regulator [Loktanella sp. IMCC34160]